MTIAMLVFGSWCSAPAHGGVVHVRQDGTGDFVDLQEGIEATAPGDTVLVGAGRYDNIQEFMFSSGIPGWVIAFVNKPNLSIIGVSPDSVRIGPADPVDNVDGRATGGIVTDAGGEGLRLESLTVENVNYGVQVKQSHVSISHCVLRSCKSAELYAGETSDLRIQDTQFDGPRGNWAALCQFVDGLTFERCEFVLALPHANFVYSMNLAAITSLVVESCVFEGFGSGVYLWGGGTATITNNEFRGWEDGIGDATSTNLGVNAIWLSEGVVADVSNNTVSQHHENSLVFKQSHITGSGNDLAPSHVHTLFSDAGRTGTITFNHNRIGRGGEHSAFVVRRDADSTAADLRFNDWGSSDVNRIWTWIRSAKDFDPEGTNGYIDPMIEPIIPSVPAQTAPVSRLKGRYRRPSMEGQ